MITSKLNQSLSGRAALYTAGQVALNFLSVISSPIFVRLMTTSEYGLAAIYFTWVNLLSNIVGLRADASIQSASVEYGEEKLPAYVSSVTLLSLGFFALVFIISVSAREQLAQFMGFDSLIVLLCVVTSFAIACSNIRLSWLNVTRNASGNMLMSLVLSALQIICSVALLLVMTGNGFIARILGYSVPSIGMAFFFLLYFYRKGRTLLNRDYWRFCLKLSLPLIFNGIAYLLINQCGRLMVNSLMGSDAAGIYSFAYNCALPISVVCSAMNSAWTPEYFLMMKQGRQEDLSRRANGYMVNITLISMGLMLVCPEVLKVLGTEDYYKGIDMLPLVVMAYYFQYLYTWPFNCELYFKQTRLMTVATISATAVNVLLNFILIPYFGLVGAGVASLGSFVTLFVLHDFIARIGTSGYSFSWAWYMRGIVPLIVAMSITFFLLDIAIIRWAFACSVGAVLLYRFSKYKSLF